MRVSVLSIHMTFAALLLPGCGGGEVAGSGPEQVARPVTTFTLEEAAPTPRTRYMGVITPYRQEDVGFEVSGRLTMVRDVGVEVEGPTIDFEGQVIRKGDVIAAIDDQRYAQKVKSLELKIASSRASLAAQLIDLEGVAAARVKGAEAMTNVARDDVVAAEEKAKAAEAQVELARKDFARARELEQKGVASKRTFDQAKSQVDAAEAEFSASNAARNAARNKLASQQASLAEAQATLKFKEAEIGATRAKIAELEQELAIAQTDLEDCTLRAPYTGLITERYAARGGYMQSGAPVVQLTLIDPVKVEVTVSAEVDRQVKLNTQVQIHPPDAPTDAPWFGNVAEKNEVADPATRTFTVGAMVRNVRLGGGESAGRGVEAMPAVHRFRDEGGPLYVAQRCVLREGDRSFVLRLPNRTTWQKAAELTGPIVPEKIAVSFGEAHLTFLDIAMREVKGELKAGQLLLMDPKPAHLKGVDLRTRTWVLRPGDLLPVTLRPGAARTGLYVPLRAIRELNGQLWVYAVADGKAKKVPVAVHEAAGELRRVTGEGLAAGQQIVLKGAHYVADGEPVSVTTGVK